MSTADQRRQELLAKRAKLAELQKAREHRESSRSKRDSLLPSSADTGTNTPSQGPDVRRDFDDLLEKLGESTRNGSPARRITSRPSSIGGLGSLSPGITDDRAPRTPPRDRVTYTTSQATQTESNGDTTTETTTQNGSQQATSAIAEAKKEVMVFNAAVQTDERWARNETDSEDEQDIANRTSIGQRRPSRKDKEREEELRQKLRKEIEEELSSLKDPAAVNQESPQKGTDRINAQQGFFNRPLTDEEMNAVVASDDFLNFVNRSSKVIERALEEDYDVLADYALAAEEYDEDDDTDALGRSRTRKGRRLKEVAQLWDERWSKRRMISDITFSPKFPELLLASYTKNHSAPQDPSGLIQVWNLHLHSRPEYTFHSTSDVLTAKFSPFHPSLIVGGCYSGQVAIWDTRSNSHNPIQRTRLSGAAAGGHTHPVYSVDIVGTQNANSIISCSTDGVVCAWAVDMLAKPQDYLELINPHPGRTDEVSPTCVGFPPSDPTSFLVGTEEGSLFPCHRYDRAGARAGVDQDIRYKGHTAPIMGLDFHTARGPVDLSDLVLTSSLDWSVKLWKVRPFGSSSRASAAASRQYAPGESTTEDIGFVAEFPREDVVYDARWAPHRPGVFASVDGAGSVEVWDLLVDTEIPVAKATPATTVGNASSGGYGLQSLNKVAWDEKEGKRLAVGGAAGIITAYEVGNDLAGEGVKSEDWASMKKLVGRLERGMR